jgi:hypothetical protein
MHVVPSHIPAKAQTAGTSTSISIIVLGLTKQKERKVEIKGENTHVIKLISSIF